MNGIDSAIASLLATRVDSLLSTNAPSNATAQTGASGLSGDTPATGVGAPVANAPLPASAQTALSAVALTLDAISRFGGDATVAVVGQVPVWPAAPALDVAAGALPLFDPLAGSSGAAAFVSSRNFTPASAPGAATSSVSASPVPIAALATALKQTVTESGLFYEAHLAQWLAGQRSPASLAGEPQNRLVAVVAVNQSQLDWSGDAGAFASSQPSPGASTSPSKFATATAQNGGPAGVNVMPRSAFSAQQSLPNMRFAAPDAASNAGPPPSAQTSRALHVGSDLLATGSADTQQPAASTIHPATILLVRQQLDLLATGQFRWTGEAWPGAKLDWTIEQDGDEWQRAGHGADSEEEHPWRTRLTLSLPTLGTVDAELVLSGTQLIARVQASPGGAARLASQGGSFRQRLAAAGIQLNGLSIREIGGGVPGAGSAAAAASSAQAQAAYAWSAGSAASASASGHGSAVRPVRADNDFDWDAS